MKNRVCFVMLVGMPGCGKSALAEKYKDKYEVISSDRIREELLGDIKDQKHNADVFKEMDARTIQCLKDGKNVIYDEGWDQIAIKHPYFEFRTL